MNTVSFRIFTALISLFYLLPYATSVGTLPSKDQILAEMVALQTNPDTGIRQRILSKLDDSGFVVTEKCMPSLYKIVSKLAKKLCISVPTIIIYTGGDTSTSNGAFGGSLYHNFGCIIIGQNLINKLSVGELEAFIAHELNHISHNHCLITLPLSMMGGIIKRIPLISRLHPKYQIALSALSRYHEVQADLGAVQIIDDGKMLSDGLDKRVELSAGRYEELLRACEQDPYRAFFLDHPLLEERKKYIAVAARKKALKRGC